MAFDNKGADWLQADTKVANPYFGDAMLRCGEVRRTIEPSSEGSDR
jgi:Cu(I)/Ag(I) efflux system membrane fusion protein